VGENVKVTVGSSVVVAVHVCDSVPSPMPNCFSVARGHALDDDAEGQSVGVAGRQIEQRNAGDGARAAIADEIQTVAALIVFAGRCREWRPKSSRKISQFPLKPWPLQGRLRYCHLLQADQVFLS
jgi:hypothetical protein